MGAGKFFGGCGKVGVLHATGFAEAWGEQDWGIRQCCRIGRGVKLIEKIREAAVKGIAAHRQLRNFSQCFRSHILPSSNKPSTRYCVFTGMRLAG